MAPDADFSIDKGCMHARLRIASTAARRAAPAQTPAPDHYAGSEACQVCHEDIAKAFAKNPHSAVEKEQEAWLGEPVLRVLPRPWKVTTSKPLGGHHSQSRETARRRSRRLLPRLSSQPAHSRGTHSERARAQPGDLGHLPHGTQIGGGTRSCGGAPL